MDYLDHYSSLDLDINVFYFKHELGVILFIALRIVMVFPYRDLCVRQFVKNLMIGLKLQNHTGN